MGWNHQPESYRKSISLKTDRNLQFSFSCHHVFFSVRTWTQWFAPKKNTPTKWNKEIGGELLDVPRPPTFVSFLTFFFNSQLASVKLQHFKSVKQSPKRKTEKSPKTNQTKPQSPLLSLPGRPPIWVQKNQIHHVDFVPKVLNDQVHRWLFETSQPNGLHEVWCKFSMWWLHHIYYLGGGFNFFYFNPYLGEWSNLTSIF